MRREWLRLRIVISGLVALGVGVTINVLAAVLPALVPRVDIVVANVLQTLYIVGDVAIVGGPMAALLLVRRRDFKRAHAWLVDRTWPSLKRMASPDQPVRARRLPLAMGLPILILLVLVVMVVAIASRDAAWTAGTAAITTMIVLAYQGWQVQESTAVSAQALVIGLAAAIEAEKRRLDGKAPRIRVSLDAPDWPPTGGRLHVGAEPTQLAEGHVFRLPKNAGDRLGLWVQGRVSNEGTQTVDVELRGLRHWVELPGVPSDTPGRSPWSEPGTFRQPLAPGETICFRLQGECPVSEWKVSYEAEQYNRSRKAGELPMALPAGVGGVVVVDDGDDNGVVDTWSLSLSGCPLEPVPDEYGAWHVPSVLRDRLPIRARVSPRQRAYWRSKIRGHELPQAEG
jgi:hypothetical protein